MKDRAGYYGYTVRIRGALAESRETRREKGDLKLAKYVSSGEDRMRIGCWNARDTSKNMIAMMGRGERQGCS